MLSDKRKNFHPKNFDVTQDPKRVCIKKVRAHFHKVKNYEMNSSLQKYLTDFVPF